MELIDLKTKHGKECIEQTEKELTEEAIKEFIEESANEMRWYLKTLGRTKRELRKKLA